MKIWKNFFINYYANFYKIWLIVIKAARGFINENLKKCAERKTYIKRVGRLAERVKKNAPILTAPVKKCRGRKCRKNRGWADILWFYIEYLII